MSVKDVALDKKMAWKYQDVQGTLVGENVASGKLKKEFLEEKIRTDITDLNNNEGLEITVDLPATQDILGYNHGGSMSMSERAAFDGFDYNNDGQIIGKEMTDYREFLKLSDAEKLNYKRERETNN